MFIGSFVPTFSSSRNVAEVFEVVLRPIMAGCKFSGHGEKISSHSFSLEQDATIDMSVHEQLYAVHRAYKACGL